MIPNPKFKTDLENTLLQMRQGSPRASLVLEFSAREIIATEVRLNFTSDVGSDKIVDRTVLNTISSAPRYSSRLRDVGRPGILLRSVVERRQADGVTCC